MTDSREEMLARYFDDAQFSRVDGFAVLTCNKEQCQLIAAALRAAPAMTDNREELLPCPFCGGEAERYDEDDPGSFNHGMSCIQCKRCAASSAMHGDRKENLFANWNERVAPAPTYRAPKMGCICPPTSEKTCESPLCPRKNHLKAAGTLCIDDPTGMSMVEDITPKGNRK